MMTEINMTPSYISPTAYIHTSRSHFMIFTHIHTYIPPSIHMIHRYDTVHTYIDIDAMLCMYVCIPIPADTYRMYLCRFRDPEVEGATCYVSSISTDTQTAPCGNRRAIRDALSCLPAAKMLQQADRFFREAFSIGFGFLHTGLGSTTHSQHSKKVLTIPKDSLTQQLSIIKPCVFP